jgi:hypothetical protein
MPAYISSPFRPTPKLLVAGTPEYLWGSWLANVAPTQGTVVSNSSAGTAGTLNVQILSGNVPIVNSLITVVGTANSSGVFNVTNATITSVSAPANPDAGYYSLGYAVSATTQATALDSGQFIVPQIEIGEPLAATSSAPVVMPYANATFNLNQGLTAVVSFPSLPTSVIVSLQQAVFDKDSEYATVAVVATVSGGAVTAAGGQITVDPTVGRFFRFSNGTVTGGTLPTIIAKLLF